MKQIHTENIDSVNYVLFIKIIFISILGRKVGKVNSVRDINSMVFLELFLTF